MSQIWWLSLYIPIYVSYPGFTGACIFGPAANCTFPCRCSYGNTGGQCNSRTELCNSGGHCNSSTGVCNSGVCLTQNATDTFIGIEWKGARCQTGNVALGTTAYYLTNTSANNVVDGLIGKNSACTTVDTHESGGRASVTVDLGSLYRVYNVTVYNTHNQNESIYLGQYDILQWNNTTQPVGCGGQVGNVSVGAKNTSNCKPNSAVRYIKIEKKENANYSKRMTICEIEVIGHLYNFNLAPIIRPSSATITTTSPSITATTTTITTAAATTTIITPSSATITTTPPSITVTTTTASPTTIETTALSNLVTERSSTTNSPTESITIVTSSSDLDKGSHGGLIAGVVVIPIVIVIVLVVLLLFIIVRRHRRNVTEDLKNKDSDSHSLENIEKGAENTANSAFDNKLDDTPVTAATAFVQQSKPNLENVTVEKLPVAVVSPQGQEDVYGNVGFSRPNTRVNVIDLVDYVHRNYSVDHNGHNNSFHEEYQRIPVGINAKADVSGKTTVRQKNRFLNIHAYDHSRVLLDIINDNEDSDYINANYITGYKGKENTYVATQGPKPESIVDFWRMIWLIKTNQIVMVTGIREKGKVKCDVYWPESVAGVKKYGLVSVKNISVAIFADYTVRIFQIEQEGDTEIRTIRHMHFTSWPDKSVPKQSYPLLTFRRKVHSYDGDHKGPMVVHCSAGIGRTGTFIALDYLLEEGETEGAVDVYEYVCLMRSERMNMVQTLPQYQFIYSALMDAFKTGITAIPCQQFTSEYAQNNQDKLTRQFNTLTEIISTSPPVDSAGNLEENRHRNRNQTIVPAERGRPYLMRCGDHHNDYINAVFVAGFKKRYSCIATQMPLESTVADFWRLIWDQSSKTIVMLNHINTDEQSEESDGAVYWPEAAGPIKQYGPIQVELLSEERRPIMYVRELRIQNTLKPQEQVVTVRQFQFTGWPVDSPVPAKAANFTDLLEEVEKWQQTSGNGPIITHCMNGSTRSGIFCAASYMIDRLKEDQEVDIFTTVRYIRQNRPQFIETVEQYIYLHELAAEYMSHYDTYANFK